MSKHPYKHPLCSNMDLESASFTKHTMKYALDFVFSIYMKNFVHQFLISCGFFYQFCFGDIIPIFSLSVVNSAKFVRDSFTGIGDDLCIFLLKLCIYEHYRTVPFRLVPCQGHCDRWMGDQLIQLRWSIGFCLFWSTVCCVCCVQIPVYCTSIFLYQFISPATIMPLPPLHGGKPKQYM